jgi:hypothetical protein
MKMPALPRETTTDQHGFDLWDDDAVIAYGRAVAESCAKLCEELAAMDRRDSDSLICAAAIREMAKEG